MCSRASRASRSVNSDLYPRTEYQNSERDEIIEDNWKEQLCKYVRNVGDGRRLDGQRFAEARKPIRTLVLTSKLVKILPFPDSLCLSNYTIMGIGGIRGA